MDHHKTAAPTLLVLLLICLAMGAWGFKTLRQGFPESPISTTSGPYCIDRPVDAGAEVYPQDVMVSVYNAGTEAGVASRTMGDLLDRGFVRGLTGNVDSDVRFVQVWSDEPRNPAVQLVARQFGKRTKIARGNPEMGQGVVVVVGDRLKGLKRKVPSLTAANATTICSPPLDATD